ncbi:MAG: transcription elongation factor GreA, partial [Synergistaceae bacterium]|nr:transcription elongation factor GreA [Synergistaceae bacterium]
MPEQVVLTRGGYEMMKQKLRYLKTDRIQEVAAKLEKARGFGDLSENAEYAAAKEEQSQLDKQINNLQATLSGSIKIKDNENLDTSRVGIGVVVTLEDLDNNNKIYKYMLVGSEE